MSARLLLYFFSFLTFHYGHAQEKIWFQDNFDDNRNGWLISKSETVEYAIRDGHYVLTNKDNAHSLHWMFKNIYMNPVKDFTVETRFKLVNIQNEGNAGFFLTDSNGKMNFFCMNSSSKAFWIGYNANGTWGSHTATETGSANSGWQKTDALNAKGEYNTLKLERKGNSLSFFINDKKVMALPANEFCSDLRKFIGFVTETAAEMQIDYIHFDQDNWKDVADPNALPLPAKNIGANINTTGDELNAVLTADQKTLFFTRLHSKDNYEGIITNEKEDDGDIYYSNYSDGAWTEAKRLEDGISNGTNNAIASVSPDGNSLLLFGSYDKASQKTNMQGGVSISHRTKEGWSYPETLNIKNYYSNTRIVNFFMADNQQTLILCIQRADSKGEADFYVSFKQKDNSWTEPKRMGDKLNTVNTDFSPFVAADGKTLYFASWHLPGYGEADMFMSERLDDSWTKWSDPINMGPAINNEYFNAYYKISTDGKVIYYSSDKNSLGYSDIFMSELPKSLQPEAVTLIKGKVLDAKTNQPLSAMLRYENIDNGNSVGESRADATTGEYSFVLPYGQQYGFHAEADGYIAVNEHLDLSEMNTYQEIEKIIYLVPIEIGQVIQLKNVFFKQSLDELLPNSYPELDRLISVLKENRTLEIEIQGHTDNHGDPKLNLLLSQQRATAVKKYLVTKGIAHSRISGKGFGGSKPVAPNDKEENRKMNRRVEFIIVKK